MAAVRPNSVTSSTAVSFHTGPSSCFRVASPASSVAEASGELSLRPALVGVCVPAAGVEHRDLGAVLLPQESGGGAHHFRVACVTRRCRGAAAVAVAGEICAEAGICAAGAPDAMAPLPSSAAMALAASASARRTESNASAHTDR